MRCHGVKETRASFWRADTVRRRAHGKETFCLQLGIIRLGGIVALAPYWSIEGRAGMTGRAGAAQKLADVVAARAGSAANRAAAGTRFRIR